MVKEAPTPLIKLVRDVVKYMPPQKDSQFPFHDTWQMWKRGPEDYNCTYPLWQSLGKIIMEDLAYNTPHKSDVDKIVIIKSQGKGVCLPTMMKSMEELYLIDGEGVCLTSKSRDHLIMSLEINDYKLYNYGDRKLTKIDLDEGMGFCAGNLWYANLHLKEGATAVHVIYSRR